MSAFVKELSRIWFGLNLLPGLMVSALFCKIVSFLPGETRTKQGWCVKLVQFCWRYTLLVCRIFFRITPTEGTAERWGEFEKAYKLNATKAPAEQHPLFLMCNHASFFDTIMDLCVMPASTAPKVRMYTSSYLLDFPLLGAIVRGMGHFSVWFTSSENGVFSVDKVKMAEVEKRCDEHLQNGGLLALFPEGQMNKTPDTLNPFRYGSFKKALDYDASLWMMTQYGCATVWPKKAAFGGFPGEITYDLQVLAPNGARKLAAELKAKLPKSEADIPDEQLLSEYARKEMQKAYDALKAKAQAGAGKKLD